MELITKWLLSNCYTFLFIALLNWGIYVNEADNVFSTGPIKFISVSFIGLLADEKNHMKYTVMYIWFRAWKKGHWWYFYGKSAAVGWDGDSMLKTYELLFFEKKRHFYAETYLFYSDSIHFLWIFNLLCSYNSVSLARIEKSESGD